MAEELQTITHRELMADVVKVQQVGVPSGLTPPPAPNTTFGITKCAGMCGGGPRASR